MKTKFRCPNCGRKVTLTDAGWSTCACQAQGRADGLGGAEWRQIKRKATTHRRKAVRS